MNKITIVQFPSFEARKQWLNAHPTKQGTKVYKRDPWIATKLTEQELKELQDDSTIHLHSDIKGIPSLK